MRRMLGNDLDDKKFVAMLKDIVMPFLIYYIGYLLAATVFLALTTIVRDALAGTGGVWESILSQHEATVRGIVGGIAMLTGTVPLWSIFKKEITIVKEKRAECAGIEKEKEADRRGGGGTVPLRILVVILLAVSVSLIINILFIKMGILESSEAYTQTAANQYSVIFPIGLFLYGVISPLAEEIVFRGVIYNRMKKYFRMPLTAIVLSALLFGIYHGNFVQAVYGFCMGALIAYVYEAFGRFFYAFCFHAAANAAVYTVTGNPKLYEWIVTPYAGVVFGGITVVLLVVIKKIAKFYIYKS